VSAGRRVARASVSAVSFFGVFFFGSYVGAVLNRRSLWRRTAVAAEADGVASELDVGHRCFRLSCCLLSRLQLRSCFPVAVCVTGKRCERFRVVRSSVGFRSHV